MEDRLRLLGDVRIERKGDEFRLNGRQQQVVLAALVFAPDLFVSTDRLIDIVWPDGRRSDHRSGALRGLVSKVRKFLRQAPGWDVERVTAGYRLRTPDPRLIDVLDGDLLLQEADKNQSNDPKGAAAQAAESARILGPALLPSVNTPWVDTQRRLVADRRLVGLRLAARCASDIGDHDFAISCAEQALADDPFDEEHHYVLIRSLVRAGRTSKAIAAVEACEEMYRSEFDVEPSARIIDLRRTAIRQQSASIDHHPQVLSTSTALPWTGRRTAMNSLERAWRAGQLGSLSVLWIQGESGVGKTRLVSEFATRLGPVPIYAGRCSRDSPVPFEPFVDLIARADSDNAGAAGLVGLVGLDAGGPTNVDRGLLVQATARWFVDRLTRPCLLIFDDFQWADAGSVAMLGHVLAALDRKPVTVVLLSRDERREWLHEDGPAAVLPTLRCAAHFEIELLHPFGADEVAELVSALGDEGSSVNPAALHRRSGGNAFYIDRLLSVGATGTAHEDAAIPTELGLLVESQVGALSSEAGQGAAKLAMLSTEVPLVLARQVLSTSSLDELILSGLVVEEPGALRFRHDIVREVISDSIGGADRQAMHLEMAVELMRLEPAAPAAMIAQQYRAAGEGAWTAEAFARMLDAATAAHEASAYDDALKWSRLAYDVAEHVGVGPGAIASAMLATGRALRRSGDLPGATEELMRGYALAFDAGHAETAAQCVLELVARGGRGAAVDLPDGVRSEMLQTVIDLDWPETPRAIALQVELHSELALALLLTEQVYRMEAAALKATSLARQEGSDRLIALAVTAERTLMMGPVDAPSRLHAVARLDRSLVDPEQATRIHMWRLRDSLELGDRITAERERILLAESADRLGQPYWRWIAQSWHAALAFVTESSLTAHRLLERASAEASAMQHAECMLAAQLLQVSFALREGNGGAIVEPLEAMVGQLTHVPVARAANALALAQSGEFEAAWGQVAICLEAQSGKTVRLDTNWSTTMAVLAEVAARTNDTVLAAALWPQLESASGRFLVVNNFGAGGICWGPVDDSLALLAHTLGETADAEHFRQRARQQCIRNGLDRLVSDSDRTATEVLRS